MGRLLNGGENNPMPLKYIPENIYSEINMRGKMFQMFLLATRVEMNCFRAIC